MTSGTSSASGAPDVVALSVDFALAVLVVEGMFLLWLASRKSVAPPRVFATVGAGFCLLLALRISVSDDTSALILPILAGAGVCHSLDLALLLRGAEASPAAAG